MNARATSLPEVAVIGAGPAGLIAAEVLSAAGVRVTVYERMPTPARRLLMAGRGGLNLTHSEPLDRFLDRYGDARYRLAPMIEAFPPDALRAWAEGLGQPLFVGSSGRVFPKAMKASPLLRAWIARLESQGVRIVTRADWTGWNDDGSLRIAIGGKERAVRPDAVVLALGGASWPKLGSDGSWVEALAASGVAVAPLKPANSGFTVAWSAPFAERFAGQPLKTIALSHGGRSARGEAMITRTGIEGGAVYALSAELRDAGSTVLEVDLHPDVPMEALVRKLDRPRGGQSQSSFLRKAAGLSPLAINLLREAHGRDLPTESAVLAAAIKRAPLTLTGVQPLARAISTAGGVALDAVDDHLMLKARPGVFLAGEMLDWEAPTGGYLLQASFATGVAAAKGAMAWLGRSSPAFRGRATM